MRLRSGILSFFFFGNIMRCCTSNLRSLGNHYCDGHSGTIKINSHVWSNASLFKTIEIRLKGGKTYDFSFSQDMQKVSPAQAFYLPRKSIPGENILVIFDTCHLVDTW